MLQKPIRREAKRRISRKMVVNGIQLMIISYSTFHEEYIPYAFVNNKKKLEKLIQNGYSKKVRKCYIVLMR